MNLNLILKASLKMQILTMKKAIQVNHILRPKNLKKLLKL